MFALPVEGGTHCAGQSVSPKTLAQEASGGEGNHTLSQTQDNKNKLIYQPSCLLVPFPTVFALLV